MTYQYGNIDVTIVDKSSNSERETRLKKPLIRFFNETERKDYEKKVKEISAEIARSDDRN